MSFAYIGTAVQTEYPRNSFSSSSTNNYFGSEYASDSDTVGLSQRPSSKKMNSEYHQRRGGSLAVDIQYFLLPKQRLNTLFALHAFFSLLIGVVGYLRPSLATYLFFSTESDREFGVARAVLRLYCSLVAAQGVMIWKARAINDGEIKRAFVQAYFVCFLLSTLALISEHMGNEGVVSGKFFGIVKIIVMVALTGGYGWFTFFQPPAVFALQSHYS